MLRSTVGTVWLVEEKFGPGLYSCFPCLQKARLPPTALARRHDLFSCESGKHRCGDVLGVPRHPRPRRRMDPLEEAAQALPPALEAGRASERAARARAQLGVRTMVHAATAASRQGGAQSSQSQLDRWHPRGPIDDARGNEVRRHRDSSASGVQFLTGDNNGWRAARGVERKDARTARDDGVLPPDPLRIG